MSKHATKHGRTLRSYALATACAAALAACGGGGGGGTTTPAVNLVNANQITPGFWGGTVTNGPEASTRASAVIMPDLTTWIAWESGSSVVGVTKAATTATATSETAASFSSTGSYYSANAATRQAASASGTVTSAGALSGSGTVAGASTSFSWTSAAGFSTPASVANIANSTYKGTLGGSAVQVTWDFDAAGNLKATSASSTGCPWSGSVKPNAAGVAVYDVAVSEDCSALPGGAVRTYSGIATFKAAAGLTPASLNVLYTADAGATGGLLSLDKQ